jgi:transposase
VDVISVARQPAITREGYRLLWYHSSRKEELDQMARATRIERTLRDLKGLRARLTSPRSRFKEQARVDQAIEKILDHHQTRGIVQVTALEKTRESYRQASRGRPGPRTHYVRQTTRCFDLRYEIDQVGAAKESQTDGVFPLVTNDLGMSAGDVYAAYERQPFIEARHAQLKTGLRIAPVYLKSVARIEALLCVLFLVLLAESLIARELRRAMASAGIDSLPLYPEDRPCKAPCAQRLMEIFGNVQRHVLRPKTGPEQVLITQLSDFQKTLLRLMGLPERNYGRN